ncbi:MAG TPA: lysylphosphatidylglycerol synthase transmembrane domain-containing protein [Gemmatimonadales bacterium]|nr:lysylphosphatidylglycerol synthase transmembrane domain-containing protein [Gemmatimonadales bacterium]
MSNHDEVVRRSLLRRSLPAFIGIGVSVGLLAWILRDVSPTDLLRHIRTAKAAPLAGAVILATMTFPLRLVRWRLLLRAENGDPYAAGPLWHAIALGFMANNILPLRAGELVRSYTAARLAPARFSTVLSSVAVERIFDGLTVVALLAAALLGSDLPGSVTIGGTSITSLARFAGVMGIVALVAAILVVAAPLTAERVVRRVLPRTHIADRIVNLIEGVRHGLGVLRSPGRLAGVVLWSLVLWLVNALTFYIGFLAFDIPVSYAGALLLQGLLVLGISIPSTPGFFGPFEAVIVAVLALYGVAGSLAFSYAISYHITTFVPITLLGLWSMARTPGGFRVLRRSMV